MTISSGNTAGSQSSDSMASPEQSGSDQAGEAASPSGLDAADQAGGTEGRIPNTPRRPRPAAPPPVAGRSPAAPVYAGAQPRAAGTPLNAAGTPLNKESVAYEGTSDPRWNPEAAAYADETPRWDTHAPASPSPMTAGETNMPAGDPRYRTGVRKCNSCNTYAYVNNGVCPECGDDLQLQPRVIRCRRCGERANSELVICPHCARALMPAPSRVWTMGAPAALALAFALLLMAQLGGLPALSGNGSASNTVAQSAVISMTPVPAEQAQGESAPDASAAVADASAPAEPVVETLAASDTTGTDTATSDAAPAVAAPGVPAEDELAAGEPSADDAVAATGLTEENSSVQAALASVTQSLQTESLDAIAQAETESRGIGGLAGAGQFSDEQSAEAEPAAAAEPTPTPAAPSAAAPVTNTETQDEADAPAGDMAGEADSGEPEPEVRAASLVVPTPTPAAAEPQLIEYEVQPGDTIIGIAVRHSTSVEAILTLNNMSEQDAQRMRPGELLRVPTEAEGDDEAEGNAIEVMAASVGGSTGDSAEGELAGDYRLAAPALRSPSDGSLINCSASERLTWMAVPYMEASDSYVLHLGFVAGRNDDGSEQITWVLAQPRPANMTSWELDSALCSLAPTEFGRQWRWWVEAAQADGSQTQAVSPPSEIWTFIWN